MLILQPYFRSNVHTLNLCSALSHSFAFVRKYARNVHNIQCTRMDKDINFSHANEVQTSARNKLKNNPLSMIDELRLIRTRYRCPKKDNHPPPRSTTRFCVRPSIFRSQLHCISLAHFSFCANRVPFHASNHHHYRCSLTASLQPIPRHMDVRLNSFTSLICISGLLVELFAFDNTELNSLECFVCMHRIQNLHRIYSICCN